MKKTRAVLLKIILFCFVFNSIVLMNISSIYAVTNFEEIVYTGQNTNTTYYLNNNIALYAVSDDPDIAIAYQSGSSTVVNSGGVQYGKIFTFMGLKEGMTNIKLMTSRNEILGNVHVTVSPELVSLNKHINDEDVLEINTYQDEELSWDESNHNIQIEKVSIGKTTSTITINGISQTTEYYTHKLKLNFKEAGIYPFEIIGKKSGVLKNLSIQTSSHQYTNTTISSTCTEEGYTVHNCNICDYQYIDNYTEKVAHNWDNNFKIMKHPSCLQSGEKAQYCLDCGEKNTSTLITISPTYNLEDGCEIILDNQTFDFTGNEIKPHLKIMESNSKQEVQSDNYRVDYMNNKNIGVGTIIVRGIGKFSGSLEKTFDIINSLPFSDVNTKSWYFGTVYEVYKNSLMTGTTSTTFSPDSPMTRGMVATVLYRMAGAPNVAYKNIFDDVNKSDYYAQAITWAYNNKIISGYSKGKFGPNDNVTREQMAVMLCNYARFKGQKVDSVKDLSGFRDYKSITSYAVPSMRWVVEKGIMNGTEDKRLNPTTNATRAECAKMLLQTFKLLRL